VLGDTDVVENKEKQVADVGIQFRSATLVDVDAREEKERQESRIRMLRLE
jgi:hypothetical protein